jgi:GTP pyrophosphokinase
VAEVERLRRAVDLARSIYGHRLLGSAEDVWEHALGMALIVAGLKLDADARLAALLFAVPAQLELACSRSSAILDRALRNWSAGFRA